MSEPRVGDTLRVRKYKYKSGDLWMMWEWDDTVWHASEELWIAFEAPGTPFWRPDKVFLGTDYAVIYFFPREPFYFYELYEAKPPHSARGWYCNINTLAERMADGYSFVDLDLDIWLYPDLHYEVLDEDGYRENASLHGYPRDYMELAESTLEKLRERIARPEFPFRRNVTNFGDTLEDLAVRYGKPAAMPALAQVVEGEPFPQEHS